MAADKAITVQRRFGYGPAPENASLYGRDAISYAVDQLQDYDPADRSGLHASVALFGHLGRLEAKYRAALKHGGDAVAVQRSISPFTSAQLLQEIDYKNQKALESPTPLAERLVSFWSDHFCISASKDRRLRLLAGAYEREAIRPYITGNLRDMLGAVMRHPAMLLYLDNASSIGPSSKRGKRSGRGLNENLGRELLELHTIGVDAGYGQADVTAAAKILTGWTVISKKHHRAGMFSFDSAGHEPGEFEVFGVEFAKGGRKQGDELFDMLAEHPATGHHIAGKMVRHFVGDNASPKLSAHVAKVFTRSGGDLTATTTALLEMPEVWDAPVAKVIPPFDMLVSFQKLTGKRLPPRKLMRMATALGQPIWSPTSPAGFAKGDDDWAAPGAMVERFSIALRFAQNLATETDPVALAETALGGAMSKPLMIAMQRSATRAEAVAMLLMSPQIQVR